MASQLALLRSETEEEPAAEKPAVSFDVAEQSNDQSTEVVVSKMLL